MKKFIIAFAAVATLITTSAFAGEREKANPALTTFEKEFKGASDVKWTEGKDAITAAFILNNTRIEAYFDYTGELLGTARNVVFNQLPLTVVKELNNRFQSSAIYDIIEYNAGADTFYQMIVETPTKKLRVRASVAGDITVQQKIKN
jgi:hypothetical protein